MAGITATIPAMASSTLGGTVNGIARGHVLPPSREGRVSKVLPDRLEVAVRSLNGDVQTLAARGAAARVETVDGLPVLVQPSRGDRAWVADDEGRALVVTAWEPTGAVNGMPLGPPVANIREPRWGPGVPYNHGAIGDGESHPLGDFFATLEAAQAVYPFATDLDNELDWAAAQKALLASTAVGCPPGTYLSNMTLQKAGDDPLTFFGTAPAVTRWRQTADAAFAEFSHASTGSLPGTTHTTVCGMTITAATGDTITAPAIHLDGAHNYPAGTFVDLVIDREAESTFEQGVWLTDCAGVDARSVFISGTSEMLAGWYFDTSAPSPGGASGDHQFAQCRVYGAACGAHVDSTLVPGIEGIEWSGCVFLTATGIRVQNGAESYGMPGFVWSGGHMNCSERCMDFTHAVLQIAVTGGALLYYSGDDEFIRATDCVSVTIDPSVKFIRIGSGDPDGILFEHPDELGGSYFVEGCKFQLKPGGTGYAVKTDANPTFYARYDGLTIEGGAGVLDLGHVNPSIVVGTNNPPDPTDQFEFIEVTDGDTLDFSLKRASFLSIVDPGSPVTVTSIVGRRQNEDFTLQFPAGTNVTIEHGANIFLKGAVDFVGSTSALLHLRLLGANWVEMGRVQ